MQHNKPEPLNLISFEKSPRQRRVVVVFVSYIGTTWRISTNPYSFSLPTHDDVPFAHMPTHCIAGVLLMHHQIHAPCNMLVFFSSKTNYNLRLTLHRIMGSADAIYI